MNAPENETVALMREAFAPGDGMFALGIGTVALMREAVALRDGIVALVR